MNRRRAVTPRRLPAVLLLVVGVLLAVGAPTAWALTHRDPALSPVGAGTAVALAESTVPALAEATGPYPSNSATLAAVPTATTPTSRAVGPPATTGPSPSAGSVKSAPGQPKSSAKPSKSSAEPVTSGPSKPTVTAPAQPTAVTPTAPAPVQPPARLRIPAIGVDAPVGPVGVDDRGDMAIPKLVQDIGWYQYGPAPGAPRGSAVLSGHVDSAQQGLGAFSRLGELRAGDVITVIDTAGRQRSYRVVGKEAFDKTSVPLADLFSRSGSARLTLITCGGAFDPAARSYLDNIVVTAVPA